MINKKSGALWKNRPGKMFHLYSPKYMNGIVPRAASIKYMIVSLAVWYSVFRIVSFSSPRNRIINPKNAISGSVASDSSGSVCFVCGVVSKPINSIRYSPAAFAGSESVFDVSKWHDSS